jgi:hypothetical protein
MALVAQGPDAGVGVVAERVQLWGAAVPLNATDTACVLDAGEQTLRDGGGRARCV